MMAKLLAYKQVYQRIHSAILQGTLKPGERIPSARTLAKEMGVSRGTVEEGYARLKAEGYLESKGQAGTLVSNKLHTQPRILKNQTAARQPGFQPEIEISHILPFQLGIPALDEFPKQVWARLAARCARNMPTDDLAYPSVYGNPQLRIAIAQYLQLSRGIQCEPSQVFITSGYVNSINWICHVLLKKLASVAMEDPGYPLTRQLLLNNCLTPLPTPIDEDGIIFDPKSKADVVVVTPAHQSPTCVSLSLERRQALLNWAESNKRWIIEDDYDGEYRHTGIPLPALKSIDTQDKVIYSGTFSKVMFPSLRMAYIVVPQSQVAAFEQSSECFAGNVSALTQASVLSFIQEGHLSRHIQRMRKLYKERRDMMTAVFQDVLGPAITINSQPGGMNMIVKFTNNNINDRTLAKQMIEAGLFAQGLSKWATSRQDPGVILSFTNIKNEAECYELASRFKAVLSSFIDNHTSVSDDS